MNKRHMSSELYATTRFKACRSAKCNDFGLFLKERHFENGSKATIYFSEEAASGYCIRDITITKDAHRNLNHDVRLAGELLDELDMFDERLNNTEVSDEDPWKKSSNVDNAFNPTITHSKQAIVNILQQIRIKEELIKTHQGDLWNQLSDQLKQFVNSVKRIKDLPETAAYLENALRLRQTLLQQPTLSDV
ncbi:hypothetical protein BD560DRAFT_419770 [Blakeslea trispora]|nr:hypothetical protein BD560DRAFT_419770 [Blakeslea trispora]